MIDQSSHNVQRRFGGIERLYGNTAFLNFTKAHIIVVGIGGVGSWAVEALARSAIGEITLIDMDVVAESNINRQLPALTSTLGKNKIDVMADRIREINPDCKIHLIDDFISADNLTETIDETVDFVIDCIDNSKVKAALIAWCKRRKVKIITVGGAGGQVDPSLIQISDLNKTKHDPLLSKTRKLLRQDYGFSRNIKRRFSIPCVFSSEHLKYVSLTGDVSQKKLAKEEGTATDLSCAGGLGSATTVTASFAFLAVSHVLNKLANR